MIHRPRALAALLCAAALTTACDPSATGMGSGTIAGSVAGASFDTVAASYVIGQSDDPAQTVVVYLFDQPIACSELGSPGWDTRVTDGTQAVEIKLIGAEPADYLVAKGPTPGNGQASVNYTRTSTSVTPAEISSQSGTVSLDTIQAQGPAAGTFELSFPDGSVKGSFAAVWCPDGHEP